MGDGKRWVVVAPASGSNSGASLLIARAVTDAEKASVGNQAGGRVAFFLNTENFESCGLTPKAILRLHMQVKLASQSLPIHSQTFLAGVACLSLKTPFIRNCLTDEIVTNS